jgi:hypothetical protein
MLHDDGRGQGRPAARVRAASGRGPTADGFPELEAGQAVDERLHPACWPFGVLCGEAGERLLPPRCTARECAQTGSWKSTVGSPKSQ